MSTVSITATHNLSTTPAVTRLVSVKAETRIGVAGGQAAPQRQWLDSQSLCVASTGRATRAPPMHERQAVPML